MANCGDGADAGKCKLPCRLTAIWHSKRPRTRAGLRKCECALGGLQLGFPFLFTGDCDNIGATGSQMPVLGRENAGRLCSEVCPGKASMFSRRQSCRGKSQSPVVRIAEEMETEPSKPIDKISRGEITSHRAVSKENALWPRKK